MGPEAENESPTRNTLLAEATRLIRRQGYSETSVGEICAAAGVTKGGFYHHFASKDDLAIAAAEAWGRMANELFASADYHKRPDPADRVLGYIDLRIDMLGEPLLECTCLLGTLVQEIHESRPKVRERCERALWSHLDQIARDVDLAKTQYCPGAEWTAESLAVHIQSVLQGSLIFAKARQDTGVAAESLRHLRRYVAGLFGRD